MFRESLLGVFTVGMLADYLGDTSLRTVQRWAAADKAPQSVCIMLALLGGDLGLIHPDWRGWRLKKDGFIWSPEGRHFDPGELRAFQYYYARVSALEQRLAEPDHLIKISGDNKLTAFRGRSD